MTQHRRCSTPSWTAAAPLALLAVLCSAAALAPAAAAAADASRRLLVKPHHNPLATAAEGSASSDAEDRFEPRDEAGHILLPRPRSGGAATSFPPVHVPVRPDYLPQLPRVRLGPGEGASIVIEAVDLKFSVPGPHHGAAPLSLSFTGARYVAAGTNAPADSLRTAPAIVLDAVCSTFSLTLTNNLPFQGVSTCPDAPGDNGSLFFTNGPHDFEWTNLHTHGLKVDPGAVLFDNTCEPAPGSEEAADDDEDPAEFPPKGVNKDVTRADYYCNPRMSTDQMCEVMGDNVYVNDKPHRTSVAPGAHLRYTYPLGPAPPGVGWYHPHQHGSVGTQTPTASGPLIIPESWLPNGLSDMYEPAGGCEIADFHRLMQILKSQPLESSTLLRIDAVWFRRDGKGNPEEDSFPMLGSGLDGRPDTASPLLYESDGSPRFDNAAGRDWGLINGAFQPTIDITEKEYFRWQLLNTMTMKWLDLTIQQVHEDGSLTHADCDFWLLGRDALPLPHIPRRLQSKPRGAASPVSDIIMSPGTRIDVLVKCNRPGSYVLASGAGPFHTNYTTCQATHCEIFGEVAPPAANVPRSANNVFERRELSAAVLAVVEVAPREVGAPVHADLPDNVARAKLERFAYLNHTAFDSKKTVEQCFSFMNAAYGGMCAVNNALLPKTQAYVEMGTQQVWKLRDITYHPFHMHESPIRLVTLPSCATSVTNMWQVGDWVDVLMLPVCQNGCEWPDEGSGGGECDSPVSVCDEVTVQWMADRYYDPSAGGGTHHQADDLCAAAGRPLPPAPDASECRKRISMFHCHILSHEDEGCVAVVNWFCPGDKDVPSDHLASCPARTTYTCDQEMRRRQQRRRLSGLGRDVASNGGDGSAAA
ncbi:hypothetical protein HXX76_004505 [Chlamydomonas incerta]|uniref:Plastocyanin-like domain-containing protein n=1 Tax=Chlamydomonas incerta TaxID=51695 RepID=A0A835W6H5_CHLIN|nr:hypothetical protein HXX76_004505 [Chlamydomonas incerta]|eukprot:KAG2439138.1 hypothetical protein HXX76_004505 [Chlamydomonas incerta]